MNVQSTEVKDICELVRTLPTGQLHALLSSPPLGIDILEHAAFCEQCGRVVERASTFEFNNLSDEQNAKFRKVGLEIAASIRSSMSDTDSSSTVKGLLEMPTLRATHTRSTIQLSSVVHRLISAYERLHWRGSPRRVAAVVLGAATFLFVSLVRHLLMHAFLWVHVSALAIAVLLLLPEILARLADSPEFAAKVFVRRSKVIGTVLVANLAFAALLSFIYRPWQHDAFTVVSATQFFLQGALLGVVVRMLFVRYLEKALCGVSIDTVEAALLLMVGAYLWLFPTSDGYVLAAPYLAGIAAGFVVHFTFRGLAQQAAREARLRENILATLGGPDGPQLYRRESDAVYLYAREDWLRLRELLKINHTMMTTPLAIVQASMERFHGNYHKALQISERELQRCGPVDELMAYLLLLKSSCLADLGTDPQKMFEALEHALRLAPKCVLLKITWALRTAERVALGPCTSSADKRLLLRAYVQAHQAVRQAEADHPTIWGLAVGKSDRVARTFLFDAFGYVALRAGYTRLSKRLLDDCVNDDPKFASPYLHLGEWYIALALESRTDDESTTRYKRLARMSLSIAVELEGRRESLIKRRAQGLLALVHPVPVA